jgi:hypothetical protein
MDCLLRRCFGFPCTTTPPVASPSRPTKTGQPLIHPPFSLQPSSPIVPFPSTSPSTFHLPSFKSHRAIDPSHPIPSHPSVLRVQLSVPQSFYVSPSLPLANGSPLNFSGMEPESYSDSLAAVDVPSPTATTPPQLSSSRYFPPFHRPSSDPRPRPISVTDSSLRPTFTSVSPVVGSALGRIASLHPFPDSTLHEIVSHVSKGYSLCCEALSRFLLQPLGLWSARSHNLSARRTSHDLSKAESSPCFES